MFISNRAVAAALDQDIGSPSLPVLLDTE
jgi:hypothetical protein